MEAHIHELVEKQGREIATLKAEVALLKEEHRKQKDDYRWLLKRGLTMILMGVGAVAAAIFHALTGGSQSP